MAITKIWAVKDDLNRVLNYIKNPDKTKESMSDGLKEVLAYTTQGYKTNEKQYITGINCEPHTALKQMLNTKQSYNKMDGRLAFHAVQSFKPGEVTPEECHELGIELAKRMWGNRYEVVISTHLDKEHLHNHFVVNSVSWIDGKKYDNRRSDIEHFRELNDQICKEHGLSFIEHPSRHGMSYAEWNAEKNDSIYFRKIIRHDVDNVLSYALDEEQFKKGLEQIGYKVDLTGKHWMVWHPLAKRPRRLDKLTKDGRYSKENILNQLQSNIYFPMQQVEDYIKPKPLPTFHKKPKGIVALYWKYCILLGIYQPKGNKVYYSPELRGDLIYMDQITRENTFVSKHDFESMEDIDSFILETQQDKEKLQKERKIIYNKIKRAKDPESKKQLEIDKDRYTKQIADRNSELKLCEAIKKRVPDMQEKIKRLEEMDKQIQIQKHEYERSLGI